MEACAHPAEPTAASGANNGVQALSAEMLAVTQAACVAGGLALLFGGGFILYFSRAIANAFSGGDPPSIVARREPPDENVRATRGASCMTWGLRLWATGLVVGGAASLIGISEC
jgi:hypothetical protein